MDADPDLPAHAEDLDAAFAEAVANAGPHDQAEPHPAADLPLRDPEPAPAPAAVDVPLFRAVNDSVPELVHVAAVDERQSEAVREPVVPAVDDHQATAVDERHIAVVDLTALADVEERDLEAGDLTVFAVVPSTLEDRPLADVDPVVIPIGGLSTVDGADGALVTDRVHALVPARQPRPDAHQAAIPKAISSRAWIGVVAAVVLAALAGAAIVLTMLVPTARGREPVPVDRPVIATGDSGSRAAAVDRTSSAVEARQRAPIATPVRTLAPVAAWRATDEWTGGRKKSLAYELAAERPVRLWMRQATPVLVVRCLSGTLDAFVVTGSASAIEPGRTDHTVWLAFDDGQPESQHWTDSADHDGLFAPNGTAVLSRLASAHTVRFGFTPHNAPPVEAVFAVDGAETLTSALGKHCH